MLSNISAWLVPVLLAVACITLVLNVFHSKKTNKKLTDEIDIVQGELKQAVEDASAKTAEMTAKDQQFTSLAAQFKEVTVEKTALQAEVDKLTAEIAAVKAAGDKKIEAVVGEAKPVVEEANPVQAA